MSGALKVVWNTLSGLGRAQLFLLSILASVPSALRRPRLVLQQLYVVGNLSLMIVVISGGFVGAVLTLQSFRTLVRFGAEESLGSLVALVILRELGPVVTGLLFAGRAGSALAAELGLMNATDQLSAMEMMAVDPVKRVVAPRFIAGIVAMPLLAAIFTLMSIGIAGGHGIAVSLLGIDPSSYWSSIRGSVEGQDVIDAMIKSVVFGVAVSWIAVFQGYHAMPTSEGVSRATTSTVVISSLTILALDFVLTAFMFK